jgi:MFS family permease
VPDRRRMSPPDQRLHRSVLLSVAIDTRRYRDFAWLMVSRLFFLMAPVAIGTYAFNFIRFTFNYSEGKASLYSSALQATILVLAAVLCMTAGFLAERYGKKRLIMAACLIGAVGSTLLIFAPSLPWILGFGLIVGISLGTFLSVDWAFMTDLIPKAEAGRYMGVSNIATASAGLIARPILGPIIDAFNNNRTSAVGYRVMFGIVTGFFLIALLTLQPVRVSWAIATAGPGSRESVLNRRCRPGVAATRDRQTAARSQRRLPGGQSRASAGSPAFGRRDRLGLASQSIAGRLMATSVPLPSVLVTSISPLCASTIHLAIARPRPLPPFSRVRALSAR